MAPMIMPIPMPIPTTSRDCVLVDGYRYCREDDRSDYKSLGLALLIVAAIIVYGALLFTVADRLDDRYGKGNVAFVLGLFIPFAVGGLILVLR